MIVRPNDLEIVKTDFEFNFQIFNELEINLTHINKEGRSGFTSIEVLHIFKELVASKFLAPADVKEFGNESCSYFVKSGQVHNKKFKVVFCICSDRPNTIGVITLHRI